MPDVTDLPVTAACSFCLKPGTEVATLVAGPGVYICDECVGLCTLLIKDRPAAVKPAAAPRIAPWDNVATVEEVLSTLPLIAKAAAGVEQTFTGWVRRARALGATWARIGGALGMTRQSAWERFSGEE
jgi:hypothetical protein